MKFLSRSRGLFLTLGLIISSACTPMAPSQNPTHMSSTQATPKDANETWVVELFVSGGIAGVQRNIRISSSGDALISDEKKNKHVDLSLSQADVEKISRLVEEIEDLPKIPHSSGWADFFQYDVDISVRGSHFHASYTDETLKQSGIKPLVFELLRLMNDALGK